MAKKRKRDYPDASLKTLKLWVAKPLTEQERERIQYEIDQREKEQQ